MECDDWDSLSSDSELLEQDLKDEEEYSYISNSSSKLQFRSVTTRNGFSLILLRMLLN